MQPLAFFLFLGASILLGLGANFFLVRIMRVAVRRYWSWGTGAHGDSAGIRQEDVWWFAVTGSASILALAVSLVILYFS